MGEISWLHLSDLHLGKELYNERVVLESLLEDIRKQIQINHLSLDFIFITGDLTFSGQPEEFERGREFITHLSDVAKVSMDDIILVPGNHDISRGNILTVARNSRRYLDNREAVADIISNVEEREIYTRGLLNYNQFIASSFSWAQAVEKSPLSFTINKVVGGIPVSVLALNTAWLAYGDGNEKGNLILGERQAREALDKVDSPKIIITLMHHPFDWLKWFDSNDVKGMLERRSDFILNGHEHRLDVIGKGSVFGKAFRISAGSAYETRNHINTYNMVRSDVSGGTAACYFRRFIDREGGFWGEDSSLDYSINSGKIKVRLSERIAEVLAPDAGVLTTREEYKPQIQDKLWVNPQDSVISVTVPKLPKDLVNRIRDGKCVLFAGAGTSLDAGLPTWHELLEYMIDQVQDCGQLDSDDKKELEELLALQDYTVVAEFCKEKLGARGFADLIRERLGTKNRVSVMHKLLAEIPFKGVITSNYDNFVEKNHSNYRVILPDDINNYDMDTVNHLFEDDVFPIFKVHGSYENPDSIILTDNDYRNVIFKKPRYRENLRRLFEDKSLLFVGFSFRDSSISLLLQEIFTITEGRSNSHYAFLSDIGDIKKNFFWKSRNIRIIPYQTIEGSHLALNRMLENLRDTLAVN